MKLALSRHVAKEGAVDLMKVAKARAVVAGEADHCIIRRLL
jgi:hypothetical protein